MKFWNLYLTLQLQKLSTILTLISVYTSTVYAEQFIFKDQRQAEFIKRLKRYELSVPSKVDINGEFLSHDVHHTHNLHKRSVDEKLYYHVKMGDQKLHLQLQPNHKLLAPGIIIERRRHRYGNISDSQVKKLNPSHKCHYKGSIKGQEKSLVSIATCHGLTGFIITKDDHFFIEPVKGHNSSSDSRLPHIVYKKSDLPRDLGGDHGHKHEDEEEACGVTEDGNDKELANRERWQKHSRHYQRHRRKKRSYSLERNVEALVVVDPTMTEYYKNDQIETYVFTIMNMVSIIYHDASIGNAVNIVLVKLMLLEKDEKELVITNHADKSLKSFCKWQMKINPRNDSHPNHHDVAILLTRRNICSRMNEPCSTLGLAQVSGMCQPHRSCNINEDTGLALAYTVAHEIGHNFAMKHDTEKNGCEAPPGERQHVMAAQLTADSTPLVWSNCSRISITQFLDRDWGYCLEDEPSEHDFKLPDKYLPPGIMYDADHQCRLQYGPTAKHCKGIENVCSTLWCRIDNRCLTRLEAAAEGTVCMENITEYEFDLSETKNNYVTTTLPQKWCYNGECQIIGERSEAINGEWGMWSSWTDCTRSCGAGVSHSERHCDNPPPSNGGNYCIGERKRYKICKTEDCPDNAPDFRETQCKDFDNIPYKNGFYEWEPVPTPLTPCELHCKPINQFFSVRLKDIVTDGTPCRTGTRDMCISGQCRHVGCDWVIDSKAKEDRCGVCHGSGTSCTTVKEEFKEKQGLGYVEASVIPKGARNIRVEEVAEADNYLALKNDHGEYLLNGHWFIQWSGDYKIGGTTLRYERVGNKESFNAVGPLREQLHIMLLFQSQNPGVSFEYTVPNENATERVPVFEWVFTDWTHCTSSCGGGTQRKIVMCTEKNAGIVEEFYCNSTTRPEDTQRTCNEHLCPAKWWAGPWGHCSVTCGDDGFHRRTVICLRSLGPDEQIALEDKECEGQEKPEEIGSCSQKKRCPEKTEWIVDQWSQCTATCGTGYQYRHVSCPLGFSCHHTERPVEKQPCNEHPCPTAISNRIPNFNSDQAGDEEIHKDEAEMKTLVVSGDETTQKETSETEKGDKINKGEYAKADDIKKLLSEIEFIPQKKKYVNNSRQRENLSEKASTHPHRHHHNKRIHHHKASNHSNNQSSQFVNESNFRSHVFAPIIENVTNEAPVQHSSVSMTNYSEITNNTFTTETQETTESLQPEYYYTWRASDWSACTKRCGSGQRTRTLSCYYIEGSIEDLMMDVYCNDQEKPAHVETCNDEPCLEWDLSDWGECSMSCGDGVQHRSVRCPKPHYCDLANKPPNHQHCNAKPCLQWVAGQWSQCTKTCEGGEQARHIQCVNITTNEPSTDCDPTLKPQNKRQCNMQSCNSENAALSEYRNCNMDLLKPYACINLREKGFCSRKHIKMNCCQTCAENKKS